MLHLWTLKPPLSHDPPPAETSSLVADERLLGQSEAASPASHERFNLLSEKQVQRGRIFFSVCTLTVGAVLPPADHPGELQPQFGDAFFCDLCLCLVGILFSTLVFGPACGFILGSVCTKVYVDAVFDTSEYEWPLPPRLPSRLL